jgi:hypothetical protein
VNLSGQAATVILTEDGRQTLSLADVDTSDSPQMRVSVEESEDLGLWIRVPRDGQMHVFLLRWEYILGIDLESGKGRLIGMRG